MLHLLGRSASSLTHTFLMHSCLLAWGFGVYIQCLHGVVRVDIHFLHEGFRVYVHCLPLFWRLAHAACCVLHAYIAFCIGMVCSLTDNGDSIICFVGQICSGQVLSLQQSC